MKTIFFTLTIATIILTLNTQFASASGRVSSDRTSIPVHKYVIKRGDNLWNIAVKYHCTIKQLKELNPNIGNNNVVKPNETIELPETDTMTDMETEVLKLVNEVRAKNGLSSLSGGDDVLNKSAKAKAQDMATNKYFSHQSPTLGSPFDQMRNAGVTYKSAGENIAQGQRTADEVMNSWMNSSGHRANILDRQYTHCGVGYVNGYWVQQFIGK